MSPSQQQEKVVKLSTVDGIGYIPVQIIIDWSIYIVEDRLVPYIISHTKNLPT